MKSQELIEILEKKAKLGELAHFYTLSPQRSKDNLQDFIDQLLLKIIQKKEVSSIANHSDILVVSTGANIYSLGHNDFDDFFDFLRTRPLFLKQKIIVIHEAHKIGPIIWNKLLKTLEEPEVSVAIFLLNPNKSSLMPTITSRTINLTVNTDEFSPRLREQDFLQRLKESDQFTDRAFIEYLKTQSTAKLLLDLKAKDFSEEVFVNHLMTLANQLPLDYKQYEKIINTLRQFSTYKEYNNSASARLVYLTQNLADLFNAHTPV